MTIEIKVSSRQTQGTGASRRLRKTGRVPGIIYGNG
ncbi:MAG: Ribosomal L25p family, partial [Pseudomonadota bacterium]